jgi:hypothetical protein
MRIRIRDGKIRIRNNASSYFISIRIAWVRAPMAMKLTKKHLVVNTFDQMN